MYFTSMQILRFESTGFLKKGTKGKSDRVIIEARGSLYFTKKSIIPEKEEAKRKIRTCNNLILFPLKGSQTSASSLKWHLYRLHHKMSTSARYKQASMHLKCSLRCPPLRLYNLRRQQQSFSVSFAIVAKWRDFRNDHHHWVAGLRVELTQLCPRTIIISHCRRKNCVQ